MTNMTYAQAIDFAIATINCEPMIQEFTPEECVNKLEALKAQLEKRSSRKSPTKNQKENEIIMERILDTLSAIGEPTTVTNLLTYGVEGYELTNQKTSALLRKLVESGKVEKAIQNKKAVFSLA